MQWCQLSRTRASGSGRAVRCFSFNFVWETVREVKWHSSVNRDENEGQADIPIRDSNEKIRKQVGSRFFKSHSRSLLVSFSVRISRTLLLGFSCGQPRSWARSTKEVSLSLCNKSTREKQISIWLESGSRSTQYRCKPSTSRLCSLTSSLSQTELAHVIIWA